MDDRTAATHARHFGRRSRPAYRGGAKLRTQRFPTIAYLRRARAPRMPHFAFEYGDGGAGDDTGIRRNWAALDAVELVPRYGVMPELPPVDVELFGRKYAAPLGIAPMGSPIVVWPGADKLLAKAAQRARVPYTLGIAGGVTIEEIAEIAPDVLWFQLYRLAQERPRHRLRPDAPRDAAGVHVLMLTLDVPVRTVRPREVEVGLGGGSVSGRTGAWSPACCTSPGLAAVALRNTASRASPTSSPMPATNAGLNETIRFARKEMGGAFSWDEVARYRDRWKRPLVLKGILHPADAEKAVSLGIDGIWVSNHGGRQIEALPAPIDVLPAIAAQVGSARDRAVRFRRAQRHSTWRARWRSARTRRSPARRSSGASARSAPTGPGM